MNNEIIVDSFPKLREIENDLKGTDAKWIFRAEAHSKDESDYLRTTIEMAFQRYGIANENKSNTEKDLIREFQRKLHFYSNPNFNLKRNA